MWTVLRLLVLLSAVRPGRVDGVPVDGIPVDGGEQPVYHNQFAVQVPGGAVAADRVAGRLGYVNKGQVSGRAGASWWPRPHHDLHKPTEKPGVNVVS